MGSWALCCPSGACQVHVDAQQSVIDCYNMPALLQSTFMGTYVILGPSAIQVAVIPGLRSGAFSTRYSVQIILTRVPYAITFKGAVQNDSTGHMVRVWWTKPGERPCRVYINYSLYQSPPLRTKQVIVISQEVLRQTFVHCTPYQERCKPAIYSNQDSRHLSNPRAISGKAGFIVSFP